MRYMASLSVLAFAYSLGELSPLHGVLYALVPFLWLTRGANRIFYLISFALAVLTAFGLDALLDPANYGRSWMPARRILKWVAIGAAAALFLPGIFTQLNLGIWNAFSLLLILGSCGWFVHLAANPATAGLRVMLAVFILFDLAAFSWLEADKTKLSKAGDRFDQMVSLRGAAEFVKARPEPHRVRIAVEPQPNIGDVYGIESVWGGGAAALTEYSELGFRDDLLNVRYTIKPASAPDPGPIYIDPSWKVYENQNAWPRAWIVHQVVVESSHGAAIRRLDQPGINLHQTAILETQLPRRPDPAGGAGESVRFRSYEPERMAGGCQR